MYKSNNLAEQLLLFLQSGTSTAQTGCASFIGYLEKALSDNLESGNFSAYTKLSSTLSRFRAFLVSEGELKDGDLSFRDLTGDLMIRFERYLKRGYLSMNTTSFYMRILRSYFNKGISEGLFFTFTNPFRGVYTGTSKTKKRAVNEDVISMLTQVSLPQKYELARDIFLFSFYTRGMSFVDIVSLKRENVVNGEIKYCRKKTGQTIRIEITPCILEIINKYSGKSDDGSIFPLLVKKNKRIRYNTSLKNLNNHLAEISKILGQEKPVTTYVARHSWATIAKEAGIPISTISEGMGHTSEKTTLIYINSINQKTIDDANRLIIQSLKKRRKKEY